MLLLGWLASLATGCGGADYRGFGDATHPEIVDEHDAALPDGSLTTHGGVMRRAWRTAPGERVAVHVAAGAGSRFEVAAAPGEGGRAHARVRVEDPFADPRTVLDDVIEGDVWRRLAFDLSSYAGRTVTIVLECTGSGDTGAPVDWGEPIVLERTALPPPPNLVLVTLDTTRADVAGDPRVAPNLARLARDGVSFDDAWSAATSTTPGHASILTGLPVERHGSVSNRSDLDPALETVAEALAARGYQTAASVTVDHIGPEAGFAQGFDRFRPPQPGDATDGVRSVETVLHWLDGWAGDDRRPFFLWVHLFDPHTPYGPPLEFIAGELAERGLVLPPRRVEPPTVPIFPGPLPTPLAWLEGITSRTHVDALYRAGVAYADHLVGRIVGRFDALGLTDDTVFVVTADHGEALGEQGVFYQHAGLFPASLRVPLIVSGPGWRGGVRTTARVSSLDVRPTLLAIADRDVAASPLARSLEAPDPGRRVWFAESGLAQLGFRDAEVHFAHALAAGQFGVLLEQRETGPYVRAIGRYAPGASWLFDVRADPALAHNLADDPGAGIDRYRGLVRERARGSAARARHRPIDPAAEAELRALGYTDDR